MSKRLNILGHVLVILIILAEIGNIIARQPPDENSTVIMQLLHYLSSNASVYALTVTVVLLLFFSKAIKNKFDEFIDCHRFKKPDKKL